jgi:hypothetical protein
MKKEEIMVQCKPRTKSKTKEELHDCFLVNYRPTKAKVEIKINANG